MVEESQSLEDTLKARAKTHGAFTDNAEVSQAMKELLRESPQWHNRMSPQQREALDMIVHKIARIVNGDANHADSWHDIAGYATLVEQGLNNR